MRGFLFWNIDKNKNPILDIAIVLFRLLLAVSRLLRTYVSLLILCVSFQNLGKLKISHEQGQHHSEDIVTWDKSEGEKLPPSVYSGNYSGTLNSTIYLLCIIIPLQFSLLNRYNALKSLGNPRPCMRCVYVRRACSNTLGRFSY